MQLAELREYASKGMASSAHRRTVPAADVVTDHTSGEMGMGYNGPRTSPTLVGIRQLAFSL
jgi:hypothetical protein